MRDWHLFSRKAKKAEEKWNVRTMFGENLPFAVTEAYKVLRANLKFSFPHDGCGKIIGITSATQSEGKSSTACNIAYALAEEDGKVLLLEADLRRPTIATKLGVARRPGLTNVLVNQESGRDVLQQSSYAPKVDVIVSGDVPPNPSELLGSKRMLELIEELRKEYRYIVVDLPPVTVVSDAVAMARCLDGVVIVVRESVTDRKQLRDAMRQLKMVGIRVLGFVFRNNDARLGYAQPTGKYKYNYYEADKK